VIELSLGLLAPPSAVVAWERVIEYVGEEPVQLSDDEKRALNFVGGVWELKHSQNITTVRSQFMRAYDEFSRRRIMEERSHQSTRLLAESNRPALPELPARRDDTPMRLRFKPVTLSMIKEARERLEENVKRTRTECDAGDHRDPEEGHQRSPDGPPTHAQKSETERDQGEEIGEGVGRRGDM
jgi:hypothetical protein